MVCPIWWPNNEGRENNVHTIMSIETRFVDSTKLKTIVSFNYHDLE